MSDIDDFFDQFARDVLKEGTPAPAPLPSLSPASASVSASGPVRPPQTWRTNATRGASTLSDVDSFTTALEYQEDEVMSSIELDPEQDERDTRTQSKGKGKLVAPSRASYRPIGVARGESVYELSPSPVVDTTTKSFSDAAAASEMPLLLPPLKKGPTHNRIEMCRPIAQGAYYSKTAGLESDEAFAALLSAR
jgi:hypothetical protein